MTPLGAIDRRFPECYNLHRVIPRTGGVDTVNAGLKVNFASENQDEFIDNADVYANHTGDRV